MISVCIPIYNRDVTQLVRDLHRQCENLDIPFEILLIDDVSDMKYREKNRTLLELSCVRYEELDTNIGRSAIRNMLASKASYPYLIFIDNDAGICSEDFIEKYIRQRVAGVVCYGGTAYNSCPSDDYKLRWLFGISREAISIKERQKNPDRYFSTFNFMIDKRLVLLYPFDEKLKKYGYEDVFFHINLMKNGCQVTQIDNPLIHEGLISNEEFLERTEISIDVLYSLSENSEIESDLIDNIKLLKTYNNINRMKLVSSVAFLFRSCKMRLKNNLLGKNPRLLFFDLYKLGYLCNLKVNKTC
ncbi:MAG: glycosyltransferase [Dysgonomonas sp.]|nr:glycosyltransferase [Dysgonomonas sp.]